MHPYGGFRHNAQVLRVVDRWSAAPDHPGLNLTRELRESLLKHEKSEEDWPDEFQPGPGSRCLEGQVVDLADSTAYNKHDIEDGLAAHMFTEEDLERSPPCGAWRVSASPLATPDSWRVSRRPDDPRLRIGRLCNEVIGICIVGPGPRDASEPRRRRRGVRGGRPGARTDAGAALRRDEAPRPGAPEVPLPALLPAPLPPELPHLGEGFVIGGLFEAYRARPEEMSDWYLRWTDEVGLERAVCDFFAGMTDRFAVQEHHRLVGSVPPSNGPDARPGARRRRVESPCNLALAMCEHAAMAKRIDWYYHRKG